jgi:hypothetical protein
MIGEYGGNKCLCDFIRNGVVIIFSYLYSMELSWLQHLQ